MAPKLKFRVVKDAVKPKTIELDIYDDIGESLFGEGITAKSVRDLLKGNPDAETIVVRINSGGGDVVDGLAIYNLLSEHKATIETQVDCMAASMASVIAMVGSKRTMAANGTFMIHDPYMMTAGTSDDLRKDAIQLDVMKDHLIDAYASRSNWSRQQISDAMKEETWLTADQAVAAGFLTGKTASVKMAAHLRHERYGFRNPPTALLQPATQEKRTMDRTQICALLGLPESATDAEIEARMGSHKQAHDTLLKSTGRATVSEASGALAAMPSLEARTQQLAAENARLIAERTAVDVAHLVAQGKRELKITPANEADVLGVCTINGAVDVGKLRAMISVLPAQAHASGPVQTPDPQGSPGEATLTSDEKKIIRACRTATQKPLTPAEFIKARADLRKTNFKLTIGEE